MSQKKPSIYQLLVVRLKFWFASIAIKWCGCEVLYWSSPGDWEEYLSDDEEEFKNTFVTYDTAKEQSVVADELPCGHSAGVIYGPNSRNCAVCGQSVRR